ncbi:MAG: hypothetical protein HC918_11340 [Oscillatoriales cyanobacterium SM2_1_8]|nr:hypothetical protein [Oscillatoriales cyanobacterium SM2_1_8]
MTFTAGNPDQVWQMGNGRLEIYVRQTPYATARLIIVTGRTRVATTAQRLLNNRWLDSGRFEADPTQTQRLPVTLCGQSLDNTREEGIYRVDALSLPAIRDRLTLPQGDREQVVVVVAYGRNPPRLADELLKSLACRQLVPELPPP